MSNEICILTNEDFTILEVMRARCRGTDDPLAPILKRKIDSALVMFHTDVPRNVATLNSRVTFSVDGRDYDTRVISRDRTDSPVGMSLPVTTMRGLALLGLAEGHGFFVVNQDGIEERIVLEKVLYQPETATREKEFLKDTAMLTHRRPMLKVIHGSLHDQTQATSTGSGGFDDPGPSAA